ncbi:MAG: HepT-like ribonuclease domain-containing protein [Chloroflexota bacterium]
MKPEDRDLAYIWDMREETRQIAVFIKGIPYEKFIKNNLIRYAVERSLMIIGEAANHVSETYQEKHPEINWRQIIGLRNVLAHEYGEIKIDRIWSSAAIYVPKLLVELEKLIQE